MANGWYLAHAFGREGADPNMNPSANLQTIARSFDSEIAVFGDYMLDEYVFGTVNRISPESPVPVVEFVSQSRCLGGAGNVAANIRGLGGRPAAFGFVGDDEPGRAVVELLAGGDASDAGQMIFDCRRSTTVKRRIIARHQQLLRIDQECRSGAPEFVQDRLIERLREVAPRLGAVVVSDYDKGAITRRFFERILRISAETGTAVILDPKRMDLTGIGPVTVITPNEKEAEALSGIRISEGAPVDEAGLALLEKTGACHILITRGERGMTLFTAGTPPLHLATHARDVYDVTGAGDTVVGALALALAAGAPVADAMFIANVAAGIVVGKVGTACVSKEELEIALAGGWPLGRAPARVQAAPAK
jgi:D-glycero-beta-D-manno-heptose-7-phosphate kinase